MTNDDLQILKAAVPLPQNFGAGVPYARLYYVEPGALSGADADIEYRANDAGEVISVVVTEWSLQRGQLVRNHRARATFDEKSGHLLELDGLGQAASVTELIAAMSGMSLVDPSAAGA